MSEQKVEQVAEDGVLILVHGLAKVYDIPVAEALYRVREAVGRLAKEVGM